MRKHETFARWVGWCAIAIFVAGCGGEAGGGGESQPTDTSSTTEGALLVGTWTRTQGVIEVSLSFEADGNYEQTTTSSGRAPTTTEGTWSVANGRLALQTSTRREETPYYVDDATFARNQVYRKQSLGEGNTGTWVADEVAEVLDAGGAFAVESIRTDTLVLFGDQTAEFSTETRNGLGQLAGEALYIDKRPGTWSAEGTRMTVTFPSTGDIRTYEMADDSLRDISPLYIHQRVGPPPS